MKDGLDGMYWTDGEKSYGIPHIGDSGKAASLYLKNQAVIAWNALSTFENNPATLLQTKEILNGRTANGLDQYELMQVINYGQAGNELVRLIRADEFELSEACASHLHSFTGKEDALAWGCFRTSSVTIRGSAYTPPDAGLLSEIAAKGFEYLETQVENPCERAIAVFLFMSRNQFFFDANKRTASIMMNGCLLRDGYCPITVLSRDAEEFRQKLGRFYETGNAGDMMKFFQKQARSMYETKDLFAD